VLATPEEADLLARLLKRIDPAYLQRRRLPKSALDSHTAELDAVQRLLFNPDLQDVELTLAAAEEAYWKEGVPEQGANGKTIGGGIVQDGLNGKLKFQIWEQYALAYKLLLSGQTRSVALECEFIDHHGSRPRIHMTTHTRQLAPLLARLIEKLKAAGLYERSLIAIYTLDGSRAPAAGSNGDEGKNTVMLAGGMIKGGYYGNITIPGPDRDGHKYAYHRPDPITGAPVATGVTDKTGRVSGGEMWKTVMKALRIPDGVANQFPGMADVKPLSFLLRG
jgi:hypothetical protein